MDYDSLRLAVMALANQADAFTDEFVARRLAKEPGTIEQTVVNLTSGTDEERAAGLRALPDHLLILTGRFAAYQLARSYARQPPTSEVDCDR